MSEEWHVEDWLSLLWEVASEKLKQMYSIDLLSAISCGFHPGKALCASTLLQEEEDWLFKAQCSRKKFFFVYFPDNYHDFVWNLTFLDPVQIRYVTALFGTRAQKIASNNCTLAESH